MRAAIISLGALPLFFISCGSATSSGPIAPPPPAVQEHPPQTEPTGQAPAPHTEPTGQAQPEACQRDVPSEPTAEPGPPPEPAAQADPSEVDSLLELVRSNIASTDLSALVEVRGARVEGPNGGPAPTAGYVNLIYDVDIVTAIRGCGKKKSFAFAEMAEAGFRPMKVGTVLIVSVCRDDDGRYHTPDVGYAIPRSDLPANTAEALAAKPPRKAASACGE